MTGAGENVPDLASLLLDIIDHRLTDEWQNFTITFKAKTDGQTSTLDALTLTADSDA